MEVSYDQSGACEVDIRYMSFCQTFLLKPAPDLMSLTELSAGSWSDLVGKKQCPVAETKRVDPLGERSDVQCRVFLEGHNWGRSGCRGSVFVKAPLNVPVPVAGYSLQMATFIHQSQLRSTLGIPRSTSFQCCLSLLRLLLPFAILLQKELSFYCKYSSRLSAAFPCCAPSRVASSSPTGTCCAAGA